MRLRTAKVFRLRKSSKLIKNKDFLETFFYNFNKIPNPPLEADSELATAKELESGWKWMVLYPTEGLCIKLDGLKDLN